MLKISGVVLVMLTSGCVTTMTQASATEEELCRQWQESLPTRSRTDTQQTQDEIQRAYAVQDAVCHGE